MYTEKENVLEILLIICRTLKGGSAHVADVVEMDKNRENSESSSSFSSLTTTTSTTTTTTTTTTTDMPPTSSMPEASLFLRFIKKLTNSTRDSGTNIRLKCEAEGNPAPKRITWFKNSIEIKGRHPRIRIRKFESM